MPQKKMDTKTNEGFKSHGLKSILYGTLIFVLILSLSGGGERGDSNE